MSSRTPAGWLMAFALAAPGIAVGLVSGVFGLAAVTGRPLALALAPTPTSLQEAAATFDPAGVVLWARGGADLNRQAAVHVRGFDDRPVILTPLEAAVLSRGPDMVELLVVLGANRDGATLQRLRCFAARVGDQDVIDYLTTLDDAPLSCGEQDGPLRQ
jgi:hypothetical protein